MHPTPPGPGTPLLAPTTADPSAAPALPRVGPLPNPVASLRSSSRRRRLWELSPHAACPVIGVCFPIADLRRLMDKLLGGQTQASDYELHCGVNSECKQRNRVSEAVGKALDQRFDRALRDTRPLKTTAALAQWWQGQARTGHHLPGALWATLTHPQCDAALEEAVLQDVHMLQHQAGTTERADLARLAALQHENLVLGRELASAQQRCTRQAEAQAQRIEQQQAELMRLRAALIGRDTVIAGLWEELRQLEAQVPELRAREALSRQVAEQRERLQDLERALTRARDEAERQRQRADAALAELLASDEQHGRWAGAAEPATPATLQADTPPDNLASRAVLCVGGRQASVPVYRDLVERLGARFLHHDGGVEDNPARLDSTLAAADLVICQTGCISHDAYWRVKAHCKRTGKRCVFVDKPSSQQLRAALGGAGGTGPANVIALRPAAPPTPAD